MARGRKKGPPYEKWIVIVPTAVAAPVELRLLDPLYNKPVYGARAKLITTLLQKWLAGEVDIPL